MAVFDSVSSTRKVPPNHYYLHTGTCPGVQVSRCFTFQISIGSGKWLPLIINAHVPISFAVLQYIMHYKLLVQTLGGPVACSCAYMLWLAGEKRGGRGRNVLSYTKLIGHLTTSQQNEWDISRHWSLSKQRQTDLLCEHSVASNCNDACISQTVV